MNKTRFTLALLFVIGTSLLLFAQTSTNCTTAAYCGNALTGTVGSNNNNNIVYGLPFTIGTAGLTVTSASINVTTAGGNINVSLIRDTNTTGSTIATGTLLCNTTTAAVVTTMVISLTGCGTLATSGRYWLFFNNNAGAITYRAGAVGQNVWFQTGHTCCTASSITGTVSDATEVASLGMTLVSSVTDVVSPKKIVIWR